jgi:general secretion pathway protein K
VVAGLFWRTTVSVRSVENRLALAQARWIERGVLDWRKSCCAPTAMPGTATRTRLGAPIENTLLDETVTGGGRVGQAGASATVRGSMTTPGAPEPELAGR